MDTVSIHETDNTSRASDTAPTVLEFPNNRTYVNCTPLSEIDSLNVFTRMDIGNTEFWGSVSVAWMTCFAMYYILFYAALLVIFCSCIYLLLHALKEEAFSLRSIVYLLTSYIFWFTFSFVHGILLFISITSGSDRILANGARTLETITSSIFVSILIVTTFTHPYPDSRFQLRFAVSSTLPIHLLTAVIVILSLSTSEQRSSDILVILIVFRLVMFLASTGIIILDILYKHSFKTRKLLVLLWMYRRFLVIAFPYFLLLCSYFLYMLSTVVSNNNCIENVRLHRAVWLVFNCFLRICEVSFSAHFVKPAVQLMTKRKLISKPRSVKRRSLHSHPYGSSTSNYIHQYKFQDTKDGYFFKPKATRLPIKEKSVSEDLNKQIVEIEQLHHTHNLYIHLDNMDQVAQLQFPKSTFPKVTDQLDDVNSIVGATNIFNNKETSFNILNGKALCT